DRAVLVGDAKRLLVVGEGDAPATGKRDARVIAVLLAHCSSPRLVELVGQSMLTVAPVIVTAPWAAISIVGVWQRRPDSDRMNSVLPQVITTSVALRWIQSCCMRIDALPWRRSATMPPRSSSKDSAVTTVLLPEVVRSSCSAVSSMLPLVITACACAAGEPWISSTRSPAVSFALFLIWYSRSPSTPVRESATPVSGANTWVSSVP